MGPRAASFCQGRQWSPGRAVRGVGMLLPPRAASFAVRVPVLPRAYSLWGRQCPPAQPVLRQGHQWPPRSAAGGVLFNPALPADLRHELHRKHTKLQRRRLARSPKRTSALAPLQLLLNLDLPALHVVLATSSTISICKQHTHKQQVHSRFSPAHLRASPV